MNVTTKAILSAPLFLALCACGGTKSRAVKAPDAGSAAAAATTNIDSSQPNSKLSGGQDKDARIAFPKTLAAGQQDWDVSDVRVTFHRQESGVTRSRFSANCDPSGDLTVSGIYPNVSVSIPSIDCGANHGSQELATLGSITRKLSFQAFPIPSATDQDQFRLNLSGSDTRGIVSWASQKSLNSLASSDALYLDFLGDEQRDSAFPEGRHHFVQIKLEPGDDEDSERLDIEYIFDSDTLPTHVDVKITANLSK